METIYFILGTLSVLIIGCVLGVVKMVLITKDILQLKDECDKALNSSESYMHEHIENLKNDITLMWDDIRKNSEDSNKNLMGNITEFREEILDFMDELEVKLDETNDVVKKLKKKRKK